MSSKLVDTAPGGETPQYESIKTVTKPHNKEGGQLSDPTPSADPSTTKPSSARGAQTAENVRYGQAISEQGVGGFTAPELNSGEPTQEGDFGGEDLGKMRREQGYGGNKDMRRDIGA